ncbi:MAG: RtcB family protein, partial [Acidobacteria bacterium]|nr:RtcB family protein [Acidobacteriota bacterium]
VFDTELAGRFGLYQDQVVVLIHTGSRGLGHQVCSDYLDLMQQAMKRHRIKVTDRQLACVPINSGEGRDYLAAMAAAANFAFANRQMITHWTRRAFGRILGNDKLKIVYDVCHNIAKRENHRIAGKTREVLVHRKGATRAFPKGHPALPREVRDLGQPVLVPGSMGTCSYVLVGTGRAMAETFGSSCHGAGRAKSRSQAKRETPAEKLLQEMAAKRILVRAQSRSGLVEEKPDAYKDVSQVVEVVERAGIATRLAKLVPLAVMKG